MAEYRLTQQGPQVQTAIDKSLALGPASPVQAGTMSSADKAKLDGLNPANYQPLLVSGSNIKTVNGQDILGPGNIDVGSSVTIDTALSLTSTNPVQNRVVTTAINGKQDIISDLATIRANAMRSANSYVLPVGGIPFTDLSSAVQTALGMAQTAIQVEVDPTVPAWAKASSKPTYSLAELTSDEQHRLVSDAEKSAWNDKQDELISGTNIKTINSQSILGEGNIVVATEGIISVTTQMDGTVDFAFSSGDVVRVDFNHTHPGLLPNISASDNGKVLRVVSGYWSASDVPEAHDATISIQMNGTVVGTFTTNQNTPATIDLGTVITSLSGYQTTGNLVTSISSESTDAQYPSAKCMYDLLGDVETLINAL